jgi:hypothetical protein
MILKVFAVQSAVPAVSKVVSMMKKVMPHANTAVELDGKSGVWYTFLSLLDSRASISSASGAGNASLPADMSCYI